MCYYRLPADILLLNLLNVYSPKLQVKISTVFIWDLMILHLRVNGDG